MAVLLVYDAAGDSDELLQTYHSTGLRVKKEHPSGTIAHICVRTDTGLRVFMLMESDEHARDALRGNENLSRAVHEAGLVTKTRSVSTYPVYTFSVDERAQALALESAAER
jgi:hypothetical protein